MKLAEIAKTTAISCVCSRISAINVTAISNAVEAYLTNLTDVKIQLK